MSYIAIRKLYYIASISNIVVIKSTLSINPFDRGISSTVIRTLTNCEFCKDLEIYTFSISSNLHVYSERTVIRDTRV